MSKQNNFKKQRSRDISLSIAFGFIATVISYVVGITFGWIVAGEINWLEVFAVFTSYSCTYLCVKERRINYPIGAISSIAYAYLFLNIGLLSSAVLNIYLAPTLIYGWIRWRKDEITRPVTRVQLKWLPVYIIITIIGYLGATILSSFLNGNLAWTDSVILAGTILAQFLLDNKKLENWIVWAIVNIFAIYTYYESGLLLVAFQYVFFLANTIYGYIVWNRSKNNEKSLCIDDSLTSDDGTLAVSAVR